MLCYLLIVHMYINWDIMRTYEHVANKHTHTRMQNIILRNPLAPSTAFECIQRTS